MDEETFDIIRSFIGDRVKLVRYFVAEWKKLLKSSNDELDQLLDENLKKIAILRESEKKLLLELEERDDLTEFSQRIKLQDEIEKKTDDEGSIIAEELKNKIKCCQDRKTAREEQLTAKFKAALEIHQEMVKEQEAGEGVMDKVRKYMADKDFPDEDNMDKETYDAVKKYMADKDKLDEYFSEERRKLDTISAYAVQEIMVEFRKKNKNLTALACERKILQGLEKLEGLSENIEIRKRIEDIDKKIVDGGTAMQEELETEMEACKNRMTAREGQLTVKYNLALEIQQMKWSLIVKRHRTDKDDVEGMKKLDEAMKDLKEKEVKFEGLNL